jgi:hypothetical protein
MECSDDTRSHLESVSALLPFPLAIDKKDERSTVPVSAIQFTHLSPITLPAYLGGYLLTLNVLNRSDTVRMSPDYHQ